MSNERVIDEIRATLERDPRINHAAHVAVSEQAGQVTLRGMVRSLHQHQVALEIAKSAQGVNAVTDELRVGPRTRSRSSPPAWTGEPGLMAEAVMC